MFREKKKYVRWKRGKKSFLQKIVNNEDDEKWDLERLLVNPNVNWNFIKKYLYHHQLGELISGNPHVRRKHLKNNRNMHTYFYYKENPNVKINEDNVNDLPFNLFSENPTVNIDIIKKYKYRDWNWYELSQNRGISLKDMEDNQDLPWRHDIKYINPNNTLELLEKHYDMNEFSQIDYDHFSHAFLLSQRDLIKYKYALNWDIVSANPSITWDIVKNNPDLPWNYDFLIRNPNITLDIIESNPEIHWKMEAFFRNPNISEEYIRKHRIYNSELFLSGNSLLYDDTVYKANKSADIKWRLLKIKLILEKLSPFSRNIDKLLRKRVNYI